MSYDKISFTNSKPYKTETIEQELKRHFLNIYFKSTSVKMDIENALNVDYKQIIALLSFKVF